jgi:hypothetical protein
MSEATDHDDRADDPDPVDFLDPDEYTQSRRLKTIHDARDDVRDALDDIPDLARPKEHKAARDNLARAVAAYGHELLPLMDRADWSHEFGDGKRVNSVRHFVYSMGHPDTLGFDEETPVPVSMTVFARLNEFVAEVGLGADLDENTDEWEV